MGLENDDRDYDRRVAEVHHTELIKMLNVVADELRRRPNDDGLKATVEAHIGSVNKLVQAMVNMPKPGSPVVNVSSNNEEIVKSFQDIASEISLQLEALQKCLEQKPVEIDFTVIRNQAGFITNVKAKSKA